MLTAVGFKQNGMWGEETASQKLEHLGLMFGALAASPETDVSGKGVPLSASTWDAGSINLDQHGVSNALAASADT